MSPRAPAGLSTCRTTRCVELVGAVRLVLAARPVCCRGIEDTLAFSALSGVRPTIETMPLERAAEAYDRMMRNEARFRMALTTGLAERSRDPLHAAVT